MEKRTRIKSPIPADSEKLVLEMLPTAQEEKKAAALPATVDTSPAGLLAMAYQRGADLDQLERLMKMKQEWEKDEARKAFALDLAEFKRNPPSIVKDKLVNYKTDKGTTSYTHASIGNVVDKIVAGLAQYGFSHSWKQERGDGGMIFVTCTLLHRLGHSDCVTMSSGLDTSGGKNNIQAMASTNTYLQRYTLLAVTGLATMDQPDDDGRGGGDVDAGPSEYSKLVKELEAITKLDLVMPFWKANREKFKDDKKTYQGFKAACENHYAFIENADK